MKRETEYVKACEIESGDELTAGRGLVLSNTFDGTLVYRIVTTTTHFMKSRSAPIGRYVRLPEYQYGADFDVMLEAKK